jgi:2,3-bisphosphoglycerate-independent phosphoglycerate mutase
VTADHGNAEQMAQEINGKVEPHTAHTSNLVPLLAIAKPKLRAHGGILADVAPSLLHLLGLRAPPEMTGKVILDWA